MQKMWQLFFAIKILKINIKNESIRVGYFKIIVIESNQKKCWKNFDKYSIKYY
jgi:hypothetical protein